MSASKNKISANLNAFLDTIAFAEGTQYHTLTRNNGYDVIVTGVNGKEIFTDYSEHPFAHREPKEVRPGLLSSAAGRYQHLKKYWPHYKLLLELPDFSPESQDKWAIRQISESNALALIQSGKFDEAVSKVRHLWASFPGAGYNQFEHRLEHLRDIFVLKGGTLWESKPLLESSSQPLPVSSESKSLPSAPVEPKLPQSEIKPTLLTKLMQLLKPLKRK